MTPEERFTRIENFMDTMAEDQVRHDEDIRELRTLHKSLTGRIDTLASTVGALTSNIGTLASNVGVLASQAEILISATTDLSGVSRHLVDVQGELIESNSFLRQLVESNVRRLDRLEGASRN